MEEPTATQPASTLVACKLPAVRDHSYHRNPLLWPHAFASRLRDGHRHSPKIVRLKRHDLRTRRLYHATVCGAVTQVSLGGRSPAATGTRGHEDTRRVLSQSGGSGPARRGASHRPG